MFDIGTTVTIEILGLAQQIKDVSLNNLSFALVHVFDELPEYHVKSNQVLVCAPKERWIRPSANDLGGDTICFFVRGIPECHVHRHGANVNALEKKIVSLARQYLEAKRITCHIELSVRHYTDVCE